MSEVTNDVKTFQRNAKGVRELLSMKFETLALKALGMTLSALRSVEVCGWYGAIRATGRHPL